ncbi:hypothetical protein [Kitasatospora cineracea]|nr:hypothetical protein [Kitasatospora cineracea]
MMVKAAVAAAFTMGLWGAGVCDGGTAVQAGCAVAALVELWKEDQ